jgi:hypothetical protein
MTIMLSVRAGVWNVPSSRSRERLPRGTPGARAGFEPGKQIKKHSDFGSAMKYCFHWRVLCGF